jgi:hypothetical protein
MKKLLKNRYMDWKEKTAIANANYALKKNLPKKQL